MKLKKVCFNPEMMRAIRSGEKNQMRVVMEPQPEIEETLPDGVHMLRWKDCLWLDADTEKREDLKMIGCSHHGFPESGIQDHAPCHQGDILYAQESDPKYNGYGVYLSVKNVRAEQLQDISPLDVLAEGIKAPQENEWDCEMSEAVMNRFAFEEAWDKWAEERNREQYNWEINPWVWVVEFEKIDSEETST